MSVVTDVAATFSTEAGVVPDASQKAAEGRDDAPRRLYILDPWSEFRSADRGLRRLTKLQVGHKRPLGRVTWFLLEDVEDAGADDAEDDAIEASPSTLAPPSPVAGGAT